MPQSQTIPVDNNDNVLVSMNSTAGPLATYSVGNPAITGVYIAAFADLTGTVASNNLIALFNPVGNTKTVSFIGNIVDSYATGAVAGATSIDVFRITSVSGGTQLANNTMARFALAMPDPIGQVFINNPSVTLLNGGILLGSFPPPIGPNGTTAGQLGAIGGAAFTLKAGEGIVYQQSVGSVNEKLSIEIVWTEPV